MTIKANRTQIGISNTATQNFTLTAEAADGTIKLARGNAGATTADIIAIASTGNVSIGNLAPTTDKLNLYGSNNVFTNSSNPAGSFISGVYSTGIGGVGTTSADDFICISNNIERMRIDSTGNVNIGGGTLLGKFSVGDGAGLEQIVINGGNTASGDGASLSIYNNGTVFGGIGNHSAVFGGAYSSVIDVHGYSGIDFYTTGVTRLSIGTSGQIGIGGAKYGTAGQVLTSGGPSAAPSWSTVAGIGGGQTWSDVTGSRASGTTYTNSTGKPIQVFIRATWGASGSGSITPIVGGVTLPVASGSSTGIAVSVTVTSSFIVPNGLTYSATYSGTTGTTWAELR